MVITPYLIRYPETDPGCIVLINLMKLLMLKDGDQIARTLGKSAQTTYKFNIRKNLVWKGFDKLKFGGSRVRNF